MSKHPIVLFFGTQISPEELNERYPTLTSYSFPNDDDVEKLIIDKRPGVIITIGPRWEDFKNIINLSLDYKRRWVHNVSYDKVSERSLYQIWSCYLFDGGLHAVNKDDEYPLVSIFTTSYKSKDRINRPLRSLKIQNYINWEWVIFDDTPSEYRDKNGVSNWDNLKRIKNSDYRIRIYKSDGNSGIIGEVKHNAASLCRGQILVELDHDDDLDPNCLGKIIEAYRRFPDAGFYYTDCAEVFEDGRNSSYGDHWGYGYGGHYAQRYSGYIGQGYCEGRWLWAHRTPHINEQTIQHTTSVPNHVRAWRRDIYQKIGGYSSYLHVVDDYELLIRTFLETKMVHISYVGYLQYRNDGGDNFTVMRNDEIQKLTKKVKSYYHDQLIERSEQLKQDFGYKKRVIEDLSTDKCWEKDHRWQEYPLCYLLHDQTKLKDCKSDNLLTSNNGSDSDQQGTVTVVMVIPNNVTTSLKKNLPKMISYLIEQIYTKWELIIVSSGNDSIDSIMEPISDDRVRWWNLTQRYDNEIYMKNYALRVLNRHSIVTYYPFLSALPNTFLKSLVTNLGDNLLYVNKKGTIIHQKILFDQIGYFNPNVDNPTEEFIKRAEIYSDL